MRVRGYAGIFTVNLHLTMEAPFTRNRALLHRALDAVVRHPELQRAPSMTGTGVAETAGPQGRPKTPDAEIAADIRQRLEADFGGAYRAAAQTTSLSDVIARLARFPGRKSIVLFSEGLDVSPRLESVIARALAENVTVYTVHAGGLSAAGRFAVQDRSVDRRELTSSNRRGNESWRYRFLESDPTAGLGPLAYNTGGFLVSDTNDIRGALSSVNASRRAWYVLAYSSSNQTLDGGARRIEVRVRRPGLSVRARTGYVAALPAATEVSAEERALLALAGAPRPREFDFIARAYRTPKPRQPDLVSVLLVVPASALASRRTRRPDGIRASSRSTRDFGTDRTS